MSAGDFAAVLAGERHRMGRGSQGARISICRFGRRSDKLYEFISQSPL
jgi:hypothetical protein